MIPVFSFCSLAARRAKKKKKNRVLLDNLFGLAFGDGADWEDELTGWVEALLTTCVSNAFSCFLSTFYFYSFFTKMLHRCFSEMEITESKPLYPKRAKPGLNTNDVWQSSVNQCFVHSHLSFTSGTISENPQPPPQLAGNVCSASALRTVVTVVPGFGNEG